MKPRSWLKRFRQRLPLAPAAAAFIRGLGRTIRVDLDDRTGVTRGEDPGPLIWLFWHNRVLLTPYLYAKYWPQRRGRVLTSSSRDGEVIAGVMARFGVGAVRGSSNKRAAAALRELVRCLKAGEDVVITPDGPRGPCYYLQPGVVKVAQLAKRPLVPVHVTFEKAWRLKTWDRFIIPRPFSRAHVIVGPLVEVPVGEVFEEDRQRIEAMLTADTTD